MEHIDRRRGFAAPLDPSGRHALYGPPPWYFEGYALALFVRFDPERVEGFIPAPLKLHGDPVCRLCINDIICDYGLGREYPQLNPDLAHFHEAVVAFMVESDDAVGQYCAYLWCTTDAELAVGREFYGWAQKLGAMSLTRRPLTGWQTNDIVTGLVSRGNRAVYEIALRLERHGDLPKQIEGVSVYPDQAAASNHFTEIALPQPTQKNAVQRRLVSTRMLDTTVDDLWSGAATAELFAPEVQFLKGAQVLGGRWNEISWIKPYPDRLIAETIVPAS